jgi:outer membrane protein assembly factor BamD (BamD/ComL family)
LKSCCPPRPSNCWTAARCTSAPASGNWKAQRLTFLTPEEHYDYAISQLNTGYYEEAREQFDGILLGHPGADYAFYGLALLDAITGRTQDCLANLAGPSS